MKRIIKLLSFCCLLALAGCFRVTTPPDVYIFRTFVSGYRCLEGIDLEVLDGYVLVYKDASGEGETMIAEYYNEQAVYHKKLQELAVLHNDILSKDLTVVTKLYAEPPRIFIYPDFTAIHIEGEVDGTVVSLDAVTKVYSVSCKGYIDSGYISEYDWSGRFAKVEGADICKRLFELPDTGLGYLYPVTGLANEMGLDDLMLLGRDQSKDIPENKGKTYPILALKIDKENVSKVTVTLQGTDDKQYSETLVVKGE